MQTNMDRRKYPRPVINCLECKSDLILCWGDKLSIYCRHKIVKGLKTTCKAAKNSLFNKLNEYEFAKKLLYDHLIEGGSIFLQKNCRCCDDILINSNDIKLDHSGIDLAIFKDTKYLYGISFIDETKTIEGDIYLNHLEIIDKLDKENISTPLFTDMYCGGKKDLCEIKCIRLNCNNKFLIRENEEGGLCEICTNIKKLKLIQSDPRTLKDLGSLLGYLEISPKYYHKSLKCIDFATNGYIFENIIKWNLTCVNSDNREIWDVLVLREQCLRCEKNVKITYGRPFCIECYKHINKNPIEDLKIKIKISDSIKREINRRITFLDNIDGDWQYNYPCHFCNLEYKNTKNKEEFLNTNGNITAYVLWKSTKKCCCIPCLDSQLKKISIYDLLRNYI